MGYFSILSLECQVAYTLYRFSLVQNSNISLSFTMSLYDTEMGLHPVSSSNIPITFMLYGKKKAGIIKDSFLKVDNHV
jgi:hypothetical protein